MLYEFIRSVASDNAKELYATICGLSDANLTLQASRVKKPYVTVCDLTRRSWRHKGRDHMQPYAILSAGRVGEGEGTDATTCGLEGRSHTTACFLHNRP